VSQLDISGSNNPHTYYRTPPGKGWSTSTAGNCCLVDRLIDQDQSYQVAVDGLPEGAGTQRQVKNLVQARADDHIETRHVETSPSLANFLAKHRDRPLPRLLMRPGSVR